MNYRFAVTRCADTMIRPVIEREHYLRRWPDPRSLPFGYLLQRDGAALHPDGRPFGCVVMKLLQHHRQRGLFGYEGLPTAWQVLDLARVWIHPELQKMRWQGVNRRGEQVQMSLCVFSQMVAQVTRRLQADWLEHHPPVYPDLPYHVRLVVSYCELQHHDGTGYRASGFVSTATEGAARKSPSCGRRWPSWSWQPRQQALEVTA